MTLTDAYLAGRNRNVLPTSLSAADMRLAFSKMVRDASIVSARTASIPYLSAVKAAIDAMLMTEVNGKSIGQAETRLAMRQALAALNYDPQKGHFGTPQEAGIPAAARGSIRDLSSDRRLNLIIDTQRMLWQSTAQRARAREAERKYHFPYLELVRSYAREPRLDWRMRWERIGGSVIEGRIIAPVDSPLWKMLGSGSRFKDAFDSETPPFAFGSKRQWIPVSRGEAIRLGLIAGAKLRDPPPPKSAEPPVPPPVPDVVPPLPLNTSPEVARRVSVTVTRAGIDPGMTLEKAIDKMMRQAAERNAARLAAIKPK